MKTTKEIKEAADMAEKWPGATVLNFGEVPFKALAAWVALNPQQAVGATDNFDVESVKDMFEDWWRTASDSPAGRRGGE
jgi:hypothetical protein